ncbi:MAG: glycosyltransferase [Anaerolineales bacterium]|nr:glycosyltransferase [Anaerolineales bacterium]
MRRILTLAAWLIAGVLLVFTIRRWLFVLLALLPDKTRPAHGDFAPPVLMLIPLRNEAAALPQLLVALADLAYPVDKLTVVLINDGSTDGSQEIIKDWIRGKENWHLLSLEQNAGKAQALNTALVAFPQGEIIAVYDADERPQPAALKTLTSPFADKKIGGVSGRRAVSNASASPGASYTTFEGLVHQLVTMRAKNRLNLAPALLGANCAYRRAALTQVGNFKPGALLEDSDLTLKLARAGWDIAFEPQAVSYHSVPQTIGGYWRQHTRWARGFNEVAKNQARSTLFDAQLPWPLRLELLMFALGYLDRLALLAGAALAVLHRPSRSLLGRVLAASLLTPLLQIIAALALDRAPRVLWLQIVWLPFFFMLDMAMAAAGMWETLKQSPQIWEERAARK